jgi:hypothetical protein
VLAPAVEDIDAGGAAGETAGANVLDPREARRLVKRQRFQEHGVDEAEHRGAGPDAEGEREDGGGSEAGGLAELAQRVAERVHGGLFFNR